MSRMRYGLVLALVAGSGCAPEGRLGIDAVKGGTGGTRETGSLSGQVNALLTQGVPCDSTSFSPDQCPPSTFGPLQGAVVHIYQLSGTYFGCDSTNLPDSCQPHDLPGAVEVPLPWGGRLRGVPVATASTDGAGAYAAAGLQPWLYFLIVTPSPGTGYSPGAVLDLRVAAGADTDAGTLTLY